MKMTLNQRDEVLTWIANAQDALDCALGIIQTQGATVPPSMRDDFKKGLSGCTKLRNVALSCAVEAEEAQIWDGV